MATATGKIKESLVGTNDELQLSQEVRANFMKHAKQDENGELYMDSEDFINAIAPPEEDYVSRALPPTSSILRKMKEFHVTFRVT